MITGIDIFEVLVDDPQGAIAFYRDVLGITPTHVDPAGRGAEFSLEDGKTFGVWDREHTSTGGGVMFAVADIHEAIAVFRSRGATMSEPIEESACYMSFGEDPEGNRFVVHQRRVVVEAFYPM